MSGFNLPPGVSVSDIPGNRPEDVIWEKLWEKFTEKEFHQLHEEKEGECICGDEWEEAEGCPLANEELERRLENYKEE